MEILILIGVVLAIVIFFMYASKSGAKMMKERQERMNRAEKGTAKILGLSTTGIRGTGTPGMYQSFDFKLEVWNQFKSHYNTESVWEVYEMGVPKVQEGMEVSVKIDADDPSVIYPDVQFIEYSWTGAMIKTRHDKKDIRPIVN